jgi:hypothetical protein
MTDAPAAAETLGRLPPDARARLEVGVNAAPGLGPADERVRIVRSLGDAVAAIVPWDRLDAADRGELLELWARLLP